MRCSGTCLYDGEDYLFMLGKLNKNAAIQQFSHLPHGLQAASLEELFDLLDGMGGMRANVGEQFLKRAFGMRSLLFLYRYCCLGSTAVSVYINVNMLRVWALP